MGDVAREAMLLWVPLVWMIFFVNYVAVGVVALCAAVVGSAAVGAFLGADATSALVSAMGNVSANTVAK